MRRLFSIKPAMAGIAMVFLAAITPVQSQDFPSNKTITMMVGFAAGGATDTAARIIAAKLSENLGQKVVVDNKPGAGGNIVHAQVAAGPADGTVILLGSIGPLSIAPHVMPLSYDPVKDLEPLTMGVNFPNTIVVPSSLGIKTLKELVDLAKKEPGKLTFASTGSGSASHLQSELFNQRADIDMIHVPYKGGSAAIVDVIANRVTLYYSAPIMALSNVKSGKIIPLAVTSDQRADIFPDVPTIAESGYPGFNSTNWYAFVASSKVPKPILDRWNLELVKVMKDPEVIQKLKEHGLTPSPGTREELRQFIAKESETWAKIIKERNITAQ